MDITYKVFKNIFNDVQIKEKGEIIVAEHDYSKNCIYDTISVDGLRCKGFYFFHNCVLPSRNVK